MPATIWIVGQSADPRVNLLKTALVQRLALVQPSFAPSITEDLQGVTPGSDDVAVLLADPAAASTLDDPELWRPFAAVIPVITQPGRALQELPACLSERNAITWPSTAPEVLVANLAIARLVLPRTERRVFISYKRSDALGVARQLAVRLFMEGYEVFLDERSIPAGSSLTSEIAFRLSDSDFVVLLQSPGAPRSEWVRREVGFARNAKVGLLAVVWPGQQRVLPGAALCADERFTPNGSLLQAAPTDQLCDADLDDLIERIHRQCSAQMLRKVANLVPCVAKRMEADPRVAAVVPGSTLTEQVAYDRAHRPVMCAHYSPFRPSPDGFWRVHRRSREVETVLYYREIVSREPRVQALRWAMHLHRPTVRLEHV